MFIPDIQLRELDMDLILFLCFTILPTSLFGKSTFSLLDNASSSDVTAVRLRLSEERFIRLLMRNDVDTLMLKLEELQRKGASKQSFYIFLHTAKGFGQCRADTKR